MSTTRPERRPVFRPVRLTVLEVSADPDSPAYGTNELEALEQHVRTELSRRDGVPPVVALPKGVSLGYYDTIVPVTGRRKSSHKK